ncbi:hypothetical protein B5S28_g957 [[Candida] boidinii]|uniref:Unnamed protein product n=1 Tax=Candida boidinii TaxID=5477 RepID=A0ACB5TT56_CANBO|nr:hypothetical protein B5S28_g957 [[Candida] boidinii]OWB61006.1 hypothetical protein B5S29_g1889 [[Candida] boidinii]GME94538.1 unnamed protein product [[Candida] boidinii]
MSNKIDLTKLEPQQILQFKKEINQELEHLQTSLQALQTAKSRYNECLDNVKTINETGDDKEIFVPLTASLYVPGKIKNSDQFLVDVGTGYFVEKSTKQSKEFFKGRIDKLIQDSEKLNKLVSEKYNLVQRVDMILREKIVQQQRETAAAGASTSNA